MSADNYRIKCQRGKCGYEGLRRWNKEEFDRLQYSNTGITCPKCGQIKCIVMRSMRQIRDGFQPGFQRNIGKYCETYTEYKQELKRRGLVELGYEDFDFPESDQKINYWSEDVIKNIQSQGIYLSGREQNALLKGELDNM